MIEINSIEDLKPFIKYIPAKYVNGYSSYLSIEITKDEKVQDITINCDLDLTFSFDNVFSNIFNVESLIAEDTMSEWCTIRFIAKDIFIKKNFVCDYVKCDNIYFDNDVSITFLVSYGDVKGKSITSRDIMCDTLDTLYVNCDCVNILNFKSRIFCSNGISFTAVSYHKPDFAEELLNSWQGVKIDKYELATNYEQIPF